MTTETNTTTAATYITSEVVKACPGEWREVNPSQLELVTDNYVASIHTDGMVYWASIRWEDQARWEGPWWTSASAAAEQLHAALTA